MEELKDNTQEMTFGDCPKNSEEDKKTLNKTVQKIYNREYYEKNKDYWKEPCMCELRVKQFKTYRAQRNESKKRMSN